MNFHTCGLNCSPTIFEVVNFDLEVFLVFMLYSCTVPVMVWPTSFPWLHSFLFLEKCSQKLKRVKQDINMNHFNQNPARVYTFLLQMSFSGQLTKRRHFAILLSRFGLITSRATDFTRALS